MCVMLAPPTIAPVFIGYRRDDTGHAAARLRDSLAGLGHKVWFDLDDVGVAKPYRTAINGALRECEVALILIGPQWATVCRRIDDPDDDVRMEVLLALARPDITLVPVLVDSARMPPRDEMPDDLRQICELSGAPLMRDTWPYCVKGLHETIQQAARRGWRSWGEALVVAAAVAVPAAVIAADDGLHTDTGTHSDGGNLARLAAQRAVLWALIMGAVLAWVAWRRPGHRWAPALRAGLLWGALFGVLGAVAHAIPTYYIDNPSWERWGIGAATAHDIAYAVAFGVSGAGIGALVGAAWNPPGVGRGLLAGLVAGTALAWLAHTSVDQEDPKKILGSILLAVGILAAAIATEWLSRAATTRRSSA
jgi:hypothetical protein